MEVDKDCVYGPRMIKTYLDRHTVGRFQEIGISVAEAQFLGMIRVNDGLSMRELSEKVAVDKAHTTRTVQVLMDKGLVANQGQGHMYRLSLTEKGTETALQAKAIINEAWNSLLRDLTPEENEALISILRKMSRVIREDLA